MASILKLLGLIADIGSLLKEAISAIGHLLRKQAIKREAEKTEKSDQEIKDVVADGNVEQINQMLGDKNVTQPKKP